MYTHQMTGFVHRLQVFKEEVRFMLVEWLKDTLSRMQENLLSTLLRMNSLGFILRWNMFKSKPRELNVKKFH